MLNNIFLFRRRRASQALTPPLPIVSFQVGVGGEGDGEVEIRREGRGRRKGLRREELLRPPLRYGIK